MTQQAQVIEQFAEDGVAKRDGKILSEASASWSSSLVSRHKFSCIRGSEFCGQSLIKPCLEHVEVLGEELVEDPGRWEENSAGGAEAGYNTVPQNAFQVLQQYLDKVLYFLCISFTPCFNGQQWESWGIKHFQSITQGSLELITFRDKWHPVCHHIDCCVLNGWCCWEETRHVQTSILASCLMFRLAWDLRTE